jgi:hypothetical protein
MAVLHGRAGRLTSKNGGGPARAGGIKTAMNASTTRIDVQKSFQQVCSRGGGPAVKRWYSSERAQYQLRSYVSLSTFSGDGHVMTVLPRATGVPQQNRAGDRPGLGPGPAGGRGRLSGPRVPHRESVLATALSVRARRALTGQKRRIDSGPGQRWNYLSMDWEVCEAAAVKTRRLWHRRAASARPAEDALALFAGHARRHGDAQAQDPGRGAQGESGGVFSAPMQPTKDRRTVRAAARKVRVTIRYSNDISLGTVVQYAQAITADPCIRSKRMVMHLASEVQYLCYHHAAPVQTTKDKSTWKPGEPPP